MKRIILSLVYLTIVCTLNAQSYDVRRAKYRIEDGQYVEAAKILRPLAENGDAEAQFWAAELFREGKGVMKSEKQAEAYYLKAARQGHERATLSLASLYDWRGERQKAKDILREVILIRNPNTEGKAGEPKSLLKEKSILRYTLGSLYHIDFMANPNATDQTSEVGLGWKMMYNKKASWFNDIKDTFEKGKDAFYQKIIDKFSSNPKELVQWVDETLWNEYGEPAWMDDNLEYLLNKIKEQPEEIQKQIFEEFAKKSNRSCAAFVTAVMYCEGIGTPQNSKEASKQLGCLSRSDYKECPYIKKRAEEIGVFPKFPGGVEALRKYISDNLIYPAIAQEQGIQGTVVVEFTIEEYGRVGNVKVVKSVDESLDNEARRVVRLMPNWIPTGIKSPVMTIPFPFRLQ